MQEDNYPEGLSDFSGVESTVEEELQPQWQKIVNILAVQSGVPVALVMKFDRPYLEVAAASPGKNNPYEIGERQEMAGLYCETVINSGEKLKIPSALEDENWRENPDIELGMISYLGLPINWPDGSPYGTLCLLDREKNYYSPEIEELLEEFREMIELQLKVYCQNQRLAETRTSLQERVKELSCLFRISSLLADRSLKLPDIFSQVADFLPEHFRCPARAAARIVFRGQEFSSEDFESSDNRLVEEIIIREDIVGKIEVCYHQEEWVKKGEKREAQSEEQESIEERDGAAEKNMKEAGKNEAGEISKEAKFLAEEQNMLTIAARLLADIIERKNYEKSLKVTRNELFTTLYCIGDGVISADKKGKVKMMNQAAEEMTGWDFNEAEDRNLNEGFQIISAETGEKVENPAKKVLDKGHIVGLANDTTLIARDGKRRQIADSAAPIRDFSGNISGVVLVFSDVTREYQYKQELKKSREKLETTLNSLTANICVLDEKGFITQVNQPWLNFARNNGAEMT